MVRVPVKPELVYWARKRAGVTQEELAKKFKKLPEWENGSIKPTIKQLEAFAKRVHVPLGYLFLDKPPEEHLPIADFRTLARTENARASPNLIETIHAMQRRQDWLRDYMIECEADPLPFVASARLTDNPHEVGFKMRDVLSLCSGWAGRARTWREAVNKLRSEIEKVGVMAVVNGVVGNNTRRSLSVEEFRGFALTDQFAPLIFVNGKDAKAAQMFTLAHELAHIWLGESGLSGFERLIPGSTQVEEWCNRAAAEFLLPSNELKIHWKQAENQQDPYNFLARLFKVSPIVAARRAMDLNLINQTSFFQFYEHYCQRNQHRNTSPGGNFYNNQNARVGKLFASRVINAAMEGKIGFRRAYALTDLWGGTFQDYASALGIQIT